MGELKKPTAGLLTILAILGRLLPHPPNFTPLTGATLFGGRNLSRPLNYLLPLTTLLITDIFLGSHRTMPYVYVSFTLIAFLSERVLRNNAALWRVAVVSLISSILFYLITNFGVWQVGGLYPHTAAGLATSYVMALPFLRNTFLGDMTFSIGFFGLYQLAINQGLVGIVDKKLLSWLR